jgi:hypothetical protein
VKKSPPSNVDAPYGYDVWKHTQVIPRPRPSDAIIWRWTIGPPGPKKSQPKPGPKGHPGERSNTTMQLTADQQVDLSITGEDKYNNPVDISGDVVWSSSDESIVTVSNSDPSHATAVAVGPTGSAAVTVTNDVNQDGTGDFIGSISIDVVAGMMAEIAVTAGEPTDKTSGGGEPPPTAEQLPAR